jgi:hypothetical protein
MNWFSYAVLSATLAGLVPIFGKVGVSGIDSTLATTVRAAIMFGVLFSIVLFRGTVREVVARGFAKGPRARRRAACRPDRSPERCRDARPRGATPARACPTTAWVGTGLMLVGGVIVARS